MQNLGERAATRLDLHQPPTPAHRRLTGHGELPLRRFHDARAAGVAKLSNSDNIGYVIEGFGNRLAEDLFLDRPSKELRRFPPDLKRAARRKLLYLHDAAELMDLRMPPGNRLEALKGNLSGYHSIRINDRWRIVFRWQNGNARDVRVVDYH